jgi:hypothetical protein
LLTFVLMLLVVLLLAGTLGPDLIVNFFHARDALGDVFGQALSVSMFDSTCECDFTIAHLNVNFGCVNFRVLRKPLVDVLTDAIIGTLIVSRTSASVLAGVAGHPAAATVTAPSGALTGVTA